MKKSIEERAMFFVIIMAFSGILAVAVPLLNNTLNLQNDNPVEEFIEEVIKEKTGIEIDLTAEDAEEHSC